MLTYTRSQNLKHAATYFGSDLRSNESILPPALKIERFSLAKSVIRFEFAVIGDTDNVLVTKYSRSEVLNAWTKSKADARAYWKDLVSLGYTKF